MPECDRFGKWIFDITPNSEHLFHLFLGKGISGEVDAPVATRKYLEVFIPRPGGQIVRDARQDDKRTLRGIRFLPEGDFIFFVRQTSWALQTQLSRVNN